MDRNVRVDAAGTEPIIEGALGELVEHDAARRLWKRDPTLWRPDPAEQAEISDRLGWLDLPLSMQAEVPRLRAFSEQVRSEGFRHVVLCGMGGSSLAPEVFRLTFGSRDGFPELLVLDSTDPGAVLAIDRAIDPERTLYLISSKSGGTIEVMSFFGHFWELARGNGAQFCAITDPGTSLEALARDRGFRQVFLNPPDIGGRYSALSLFGLVPAALIGVDTERLLKQAAVEQVACGADVAIHQNPGAWLAAYLGGLARAGRDKLTLLTSPGLASFGLWAEQLLAESLGKQGTGVVPVVGERPGDRGAYGDDRCFLALRLDTDDNRQLDQQLEAVRGSHPLVEVALSDRHDLGATMFRWEVATALAGVLIRVHPFDQPNVQESKDNTSRVLSEAQRAGGQLPPPALELAVDGESGNSLAAFLRSAGAGSYLAIQAYLPPEPATEAALQASRAGMRDRLKVATTLGFGPRFLHSTGQLHKGGPPSGVFLQITHQPTEDLAVPGAAFSFGLLVGAQALGDLQSLHSRGLPVARLELGRDVAGGLRRLQAAVDEL